MPSPSTGGPTSGVFSATAEGHESHLFIQVLSSFALSYLLAESDLIQENNQEDIVNVCSWPGLSSTIDLDDSNRSKPNEEWSSP